MYNLATTELSTYDLGAVVFIFIIAAGLLKLLAFVVKEKYNEKKKEACGAFQKGRCLLYDDVEKTKKSLDTIHNLLCGPQAMDGDIPRWYFPQECEKKIIETHASIIQIKQLLATHIGKDIKPYTQDSDPHIHIIKSEE